jgi:hypothetical protein
MTRATSLSFQLVMRIISSISPMRLFLAIALTPSPRACKRHVLPSFISSQHTKFQNHISPLSGFLATATSLNVNSRHCSQGSCSRRRGIRSWLSPLINKDYIHRPRITAQTAQLDRDEIRSRRSALGMERPFVDPWQTVSCHPRASSFAETDGFPFNCSPLEMVLVQIRDASPCQKNRHAPATCASGHWEINEEHTTILSCVSSVVRHGEVWTVRKGREKKKERKRKNGRGHGKLELGRKDLFFIVVVFAVYIQN